VIGQENGYKYVVDSNVDWGQDLKGLKMYMVENNIKKMKMAYFGKDSRTYRRMLYEKLSCRPQPGLMAVSVNHLISQNEEQHKCLYWLRASEPIATIGYSIFIYNITEEQANGFLVDYCTDFCKKECNELNRIFVSSGFNETCTCSCR